MAQILVRDLNEEVVGRLKSRAKKDGRSLQSEVRLILEQAAHEPKVNVEMARALVEKTRKKFKGRKFPNSVELIREDRDR
ncbi:MAG: Arc family DNA-binding protein [Thermodesulfovibrionales bacterium]|nr:Arc family DNA-binding protein [Thermodesulfovibrionales bacterium]